MQGQRPGLASTLAGGQRSPWVSGLAVLASSRARRVLRGFFAGWALSLSGFPCLASVAGCSRDGHAGCGCCGLRRHVVCWQPGVYVQCGWVWVWTGGADWFCPSCFLTPCAFVCLSIFACSRGALVLTGHCHPYVSVLDGTLAVFAVTQARPRPRAPTSFSFRSCLRPSTSLRFRM